MSVNVINMNNKAHMDHMRAGVGASDIYVRVDRKTIFGNPYMIGRNGTRDEVVEKYRRYMHSKYAEGGEYQRKMNSLAVLVARRTVHLACWCVPENCHGREILRFVLELNRLES